MTVNHKHSRDTNHAAPRPPVVQNDFWTPREAYLLALVCLMSGLVLGYLFHGSSPGAIQAPVTVAAAAPGAAMAKVEDLAVLAAPLLAALKVDPKNAGTLIQLGNLYYDHQLFAESIEYYRRALEFEPRNINVRTDLGTAYWYSGFPEKAVAEYEKSLAVDASHVNTVFNMGVVRLEGLKDAKGAAKYFEKVLTLNASPQQLEKARELLAKAKGMVS